MMVILDEDLEPESELPELEETPDPPPPHTHTHTHMKDAKYLGWELEL